MTEKTLARPSNPEASTRANPGQRPGRPRPAEDTAPPLGTDFFLKLPHGTRHPVPAFYSRPSDGAALAGGRYSSKAKRRTLTSRCSLISGSMIFKKVAPAVGRGPRITDSEGPLSARVLMTTWLAVVMPVGHDLGLPPSLPAPAASILPRHEKKQTVAGGVIAIARPAIPDRGLHFAASRAEPCADMRPSRAAR